MSLLERLTAAVGDRYRVDVLALWGLALVAEQRGIVEASAAGAAALRYDARSRRRPARPARHDRGRPLVGVRTSYYNITYTSITHTSERSRMATRSGSRKRKSTSSGVRASREGKVRKEFWLDPDLLREAQDYLGASTEREAVEMALDLVAFRRELGEGARALRRLSLSRID
jgi:hypothetical protein